MSTKKQLVNWRSLSSFFLFLSSIMILVSGIVLFIAPAGRYAHAVNWHLAGLDKGQWEAVHLLNSFAAVIFAIVHLVLNWKVLVRYLWNRTRKAYSFNREIATALLLVIIISAGGILSLPPFSTIVDFGDILSESWEANSNEINELPLPVPNEAPATILDSPEYPSINTDRTNSEALDTSTPVRWGRYTVVELCSHYNVPLQDAVSRLSSYNIYASADTRIRTLADRYGFDPSEIADIILGQPIGTFEEITGE